MTQPALSIVVPMMNEEDSLDSFFARILPVLDQLTLTHELIIVNDGSRDATLEKLTAYQKKYKNLIIVDLSRNFGKEAALTAGFSEARGEAVIVLDADLQDPPELILQMVVKWQEGYEVVAVVRKDRSGDHFLHRSNVRFFYKFINMMSDTQIKPNVRDYRLMCRSAVNAFLSLKERTRFNKGLFAWLGFREYYIYQELHDRVAGSTKWDFKKLLSFAIDGITSFSTTPLRIWTYIGFSTAFLAFLLGLFMIIKTLLFGVITPGWTSTIVVILFFSGLNMLSVGILGEYVGRVFIETKQRPIFIIRKVYGRN
ncbi:MAG: glycosyltransferase family 2 protein [Gammaproteobacteria bacterium]|nr:glycosyltransferase family 2 protein [Gammaproteobacteria bacterium]